MMTEIPDLVARLRRDWTNPREAIHGASLCPFLLHCEFSAAASHEEIKAVVDVPRPVADFWAIAKSATLFKDGKYGQWGLRVLDPITALERTAQYQRERIGDALPGDLLIGEFLGDSDLLMVRRSHDASDYGNIMVVLPLDHRRDWDMVATSFDEFLEQYAIAHGNKFWESDDGSNRPRP